MNRKSGGKQMRRKTEIIKIHGIFVMSSNICILNIWMGTKEVMKIGPDYEQSGISLNF